MFAVELFAWVGPHAVQTYTALVLFIVFSSQYFMIQLEPQSYSLYVCMRGATASEMVVTLLFQFILRGHKITDLEPPLYFISFHILINT